MDSLEIVPPPRSTREMMRQIQEKSPAVRKAEAKTAELETINPTGEFECKTAELPVQLVEPWAINNVFVEESLSADLASSEPFGMEGFHSQQATTPDEQQTAATKNLLKGDKMDQTEDTKVKKPFKQRALEVGALAGGFAFGFMIAGIFFDQKTLIKAIRELEVQTQTLENVVASYVIK